MCVYGLAEVRSWCMPLPLVFIFGVLWSILPIVLLPAIVAACVEPLLPLVVCLTGLILHVHCVSRNNSTLSVYCKHLLRRHPGFIRTSFGRHEIPPAAFIGFPTVTAVTLALGFHRQVYVGYARVRH
jgi:hypothetical protein